MARLIDADALVALIQQEPTDGMYTEEIVAVIAEQPTIEATPVVHGRWEWIEDSTNNCSACGHTTFFYPCLETVPNYCKNCGAKMDGGVCDG